MEKRCLKFTGYIYIPDSNDNSRAIRNFAAKTMGRIKIFDEQNNDRKEKMEAFDNLGQMLDSIMREYKKRALKRLHG